MNQGAVRAEPYAIFRFVGYCLAVCCAGLVVAMGIRNPFDQRVFSMIVMAVLMLPVVIFAEMLVCEVEVNADGVVRTGLFGRKTRLSWSDVDRISLVRHNVGVRELVIRSSRKKIAVLSEFLIIPRRGFWPLARAVVKTADHRGIDVETGLLDRKAWFNSAGKH